MAAARSLSPTSRAPHLRQIGKIVLDYLDLQPGDSILEIGCSIGTQARQLAALGYRVYGVDTELALVQRFNALAREENLWPDQASALVGDGGRLPFSNGAFACVIATEVLEHTADPARVLDEVRRVLKPSGTLCLAVPTENTERLFGRLNPKWAEYSGHLHIFSASRLLSLAAQAGFMVMRTRGESFEWSVFWLFFAALRTPFDFTGTPTAHLLLVRIFWKTWRILNALRIWPPIQKIGDRRFPKSIYVYAQKREPQL